MEYFNSPYKAPWPCQVRKETQIIFYHIFLIFSICLDLSNTRDDTAINISCRKTYLAFVLTKNMTMETWFALNWFFIHLREMTLLPWSGLCAVVFWKTSVCGRDWEGTGLWKGCTYSERIIGAVTWKTDPQELGNKKPSQLERWKARKREIKGVKSAEVIFKEQENSLGQNVAENHTF